MINDILNEIDSGETPFSMGVEVNELDVQPLGLTLEEDSVTLHNMLYTLDEDLMF